LQVALEQSLVTLEVIQSQVEACCPTTTTTTTTPITTSTTTTDPFYYYVANQYACPNCDYVVGTNVIIKTVTPLSIGDWVPRAINGNIFFFNILSSSAPFYMATLVDAGGASQSCGCPGTTSTTTSTTTNMINPTLYSRIMDNPVGTALYNIDGPEAGKYWTVAYDYSQYTHIPNGQFLGVGTTIYMDQQCTQQWTFPLKYLIANVPDQYNINPYTWIWKVENGVITDNIGRFVDTARYLLHSTKVRNELLPCSEFYLNGITLDTGHTSLMPGVSVYSATVDTNQPIPLNYTYLTDNVNVYTVSNGVITSSQPCSGITTSTTTIL
jgi:hypothetical protein